MNANTALVHEPVMELDDAALAMVIGGDGWREVLADLARRAVVGVAECLGENLDDVIDGIKEGFTDAR
jgi:hypothetical protein